MEPLLTVMGRRTFLAGSKPESATAIKLANNAAFPHNIKAASKATGDMNELLQAGKDKELTLEMPKTERKFELSCSIHPWMNAIVFINDHPFNAVTGMDGTFEIKNVPTGIDLTFVGWHENAKEYTKTIKLAKGGTEDLKEIKISAK